MHPEPLDDFDRIERLTRRIGRAALVGVPVWIALLALLPFTGLGVLPCLATATALAIAVVVVADRRHSRRGAAGAGGDGPPEGAGRRAPMSPLAAAGLTLAGVALVAYVLFVIRAA